MYVDSTRMLLRTVVPAAQGCILHDADLRMMLKLQAALAVTLQCAAAAAAAAALSVTTGDGLQLQFTNTGALKAAAVRGQPLAPPAAADSLAGFSVRSYTAASDPVAELLSNPAFSRMDGASGGGAAGWGGGGGGYAREGRTGAILIRNRKTNATSAAVQTVHLDPAAATGAGRTLRLSGWASAAGLKSKGTCADEGSCTLSDTFGLAATLVRPS